MCRGFNSNPTRTRLRISGVYIKLSLSRSSCKPLPDSLTLVYLPRINASPLEVNGSRIRPDSPAFVTLHRVVVKSGRTGEKYCPIIYASKDPIRASEGVRFEVFWREEKVIKGIYRKGEEKEWRIECRCVMERRIYGADVAYADVYVSVDGEGYVEISDRVEMSVVKRRKGGALDEIPEEGEDDDDEMNGCDCECSECYGVGEVEDRFELNGGDEEIGIDGVGWAVDVGILVISLGLGFLVSKASSKKLRLGRIL